MALIGSQLEALAPNAANITNADVNRTRQALVEELLLAASAESEEATNVAHFVEVKQTLAFLRELVKQPQLIPAERLAALPLAIQQLEAQLELM